MNSQEVVDRFRLDVNDLATPQLWSDDDAFGFLDDAQKMFCRKAWGIGDFSSSATTLPMSVGIDTVKLSDRILKIRSAYRISDGRKVEVLNFEDMTKLGLLFDGRTGPAQYLIIGLEATLAKFYPVPNVVDTVQLLVDRMPLNDITLVGAPQDLEIPSQHHRHLTKWMRHLAYAVQDSEAYDKKKSAEYEQAFYAYCEQAKEEKARAMHKTRVVKYGGIGGAGSNGVNTRNNDYYNRS